MSTTVLEIHHGVYRKRRTGTILQGQKYVCVQLQFRSPLVEAIGKEQIASPSPAHARTHTYTHTEAVRVSIWHISPYVFMQAALFYWELHLKTKFLFRGYYYAA